MKSYALFLGCTIPARQLNYEISARKALKALGIDLVDLDGMSCCAPPPIESVAADASLAVSAYNICLAEEAGLDLLTICSGCFQSLARTNELLKRDSQLRKRVNQVLSKIGKEFKGSIEVKHYLKVLHDEVGVEEVRRNVTKQLKNIKAAPFYGCHLLRPSELLKFDDPEKPRILDDLIEALGAESIDYLDKLKCCGGLLRGYDDDLALELARDKVMKAYKAGADCIVTVCPFCFINLDLGQIQIARKYNENYSLPVMHYSELLCLAMGVEAKELSPRSHRVKIDKLLEKIV